MTVDYNEFSELLLRHPGIIRVELLPDELVETITEIETTFPHFGMTLVEPTGLKDICKKKLKLVLFCTDDFPMFTNRFMNFLDSGGSLIGHDVLPHEKHLYDNPNYVWLTDHIFIDLSRLRDQYTKCVLASIPFKVEGLPDEYEPIVYYPCMKTADIINTHYDVGKNVIATVLLGVDGIKTCSGDR